MTTSTLYFCPTCENDTTRRLELRRETHVVRKEKIELDTTVAVCETCDADMSDYDLDQEVLTRVYDIYRARHRLLSPDHIRDIRMRSGLSHRGFARLMGWGPSTPYRYETGALPDDAHNAQLVAVQDAEALNGFIRRRWEELTERDRHDAQQAMVNGVHSVALGHIARILENLVNAESSICRGHRLFDLQRFGQVAVYFAAQKPYKTKLLKLLFYADFLNFKRLGCSLTGTVYARLPHGPVPNHFQHILAELDEEGVLVTEISDVQVQGGLRTGFEYSAGPQSIFDESQFTDGERAVLKAVYDFFETYTATAIENYSHNERAWKEVDPSQSISYSYAQHLSLS